MPKYYVTVVATFHGYHGVSLSVEASSEEEALEEVKTQAERVTPYNILEHEVSVDGWDEEFTTVRLLDPDEDISKFEQHY